MKLLSLSHWLQESRTVPLMVKVLKLTACPTSLCGHPSMTRLLEQSVGVTTKGCRVCAAEMLRMLVLSICWFYVINCCLCACADNDYVLVLVDGHSQS